MTLRAELDGLESELQSLADSERAASMSAYQKHQFEFLGVPTPERRAAVKASITTSATPSRTDLIAAIDHLWSLEAREFHYCGVDLLRRWQKALLASDLAWLGTLVTTHAWWDTVDALATHPVGNVVLRHRIETRPLIDGWAASDDLWLNRTAILHQLLFKHDTDEAQLFAYCDLHADSSEFFHRKAIGWALRQHARIEPDAVRAYVDERRDTLSGLTIREALKHL